MGHADDWSTGLYLSVEGLKSPSLKLLNLGHFLTFILDKGQFLPYVYIIKTGATMPTIEDFGAFKISIYYADHNPPHFHVVAAEFDAKLRIDDLTIIVGELPGGVLRQVRKWAEANRELLERTWQEYQ